MTIFSCTGPYPPKSEQLQMQTLMNMHKSMAGRFNKKRQIDGNASATYDLTGTYLGNEKENHGKIIIFLFFQFCKIYIINLHAR